MAFVSGLPVPRKTGNTTHRRQSMKTNENGFLICPKCGKKTNVKVLPETELKNFPLYCNRCKVATKIDHKKITCQS
jgi:transcription elongation factor Elf1